LFPVKASSQSPTPTPDPVPEILRDFDEYMQMDAECLLPCWHGINLQEDVTQNLGESLRTQFGVANISEPSELFHGFVVPRDIGLWEPYANQFYIAIDIEDDAVTGMSVYFEGSSESPNQLMDGYSIFNVISAYGPPSEIYIDTNVLVWLVYDEPSLVLKYLFSPTGLEDGVVSGCFTTQNLNSFRLEALDAEYNNESISTAEEIFATVDEVTAFSVASFSAALLDDPDLCVDIDYEE
jgi:hypothetical protein